MCVCLCVRQCRTHRFSEPNDDVKGRLASGTKSVYVGIISFELDSPTVADMPTCAAGGTNAQDKGMLGSQEQ